MLAIDCKNIKKTYPTLYGGVDALKEINLQIEMGKLVMLTGPSGSGKTTLISIIAAILGQTEGECLVFGENINTMPNGEKTAYRGKHIGFVFQSFNLVPMLSAKENVAVPLILNGTSEQEAEKRAEELLKELGLENKTDAPPQELSGGEQQRVAIARSIIHEPKLIVCDEPTAHLDQETGQKVMELLKTKALNQERSLIIVTHDSRIFSYADQSFKLEDGRIN